MEKICKNCNNMFKKRVTCSKKNWSKTLYCSVKCRFGSYPKKIKKICKECSINFEVRNYRKISANFCSRKCNWKFRDEGKRTKDKIIRQSWAYKQWRKSVFERDNYKCIKCGIKSGCGKTIILNADHIKPFALFPDLRFSIDNGRTLCIDCHKKTETFGRGAIFRKKLIATA